MEDGRILEIGSHDKLISNKGKYYEQFVSGGLEL